MIQHYKDKRLPKKARLELEIRRVKAKTKWKRTPIEYRMILYVLQNILRISRAPYANDIPKRSPLAEKRAATLKIPRAAPHNGRPH